MPENPFRAFFKQAAEKDPYSHQEKLAGATSERRLIHVPTGAPGPPLRSGRPRIRDRARIGASNMSAG